MTDTNIFKMSKAYFTTFLILFILLLMITGWMILPIFIFVPLIIVWVIVYKTTSIKLTETGVDLKTGWLHVTHKQIPFTNINSVDVRTTFIRNAFFNGCGQIKIYIGNDVEGISFGAIEKPLELKSMIESQIMKSNHTAPNDLQYTQQPISSADEISKLAKLREQGLLSNEDFEKQKNILLNK